jgi:uncharacterized protein YecT (DUF1311 family)
VAISTASFLCFSQDKVPALDCSESQRQANECAWKRFAIADQKLNRTYRDVTRRISPASKTELRAEQRKWLKELEPTCEEDVGPRETGGQIWKMEFYNCMAVETSSRTKMIETWAKKKK